jgi:DNA ligase D-like protein (predicted ligase)
MVGEPSQPAWREPMLAQPLRWPDDSHLLRQGEWVFERKLDGLRGLAVRDASRVDLWSRNRLSFNRRFPSIVAALTSLPADSFVIDGEIVATQNGRSSFTLMQRGGEGVMIEYVVFDLLVLLGRDTTALPLEERQALLRRVVEKAPPAIRLSLPLSGEAANLMSVACAEGWEGLLAKRAGSTYRSGRSSDWRKLKCSARQEVVVGGWTDPTGARTGFGALLTGYFEGGRLRYAGKVGTGFDEVTLRDLHRTLRALHREISPFDDPVKMKGAHWVEPTLVAEVEFTEWTRDGRMRHPRFLGLRPDKSATDVVRELPPRPG